MFLLCSGFAKSQAKSQIGIIFVGVEPIRHEPSRVLARVNVDPKKDLDALPTARQHRCFDIDATVDRVGREGMSAASMAGLVGDICAATDSP